MSEAASRPYAEVIGDPIAHSRSPVIHRFWLDRLGIEADYRATRVRAEELGEWIAGRRDDPLWRGCNVTLPHKVAVLDHVADPGDLKASIGAANTLYRVDDGELAAANTDVAGFAAPLAETAIEGAHAAVIGAGGAARAVLYALARLGVGEVTLFARRPLAAAGLLAQFGLKGRVQPIGSRLPKAQLLVNASPLGMQGQDPLELDLAPLPDDALVYDLVYAPRDTALLRAADARGLETIGGLAMLIGQAAIAFELFFGIVPPREEDEALFESLST